MTSRTGRNIWRSKRLIFRPVEDADDAFIASLHHDTSDNFQNATRYLPVPQGSASAAHRRERLQKALLGVIVCLPAPVTTDTTSSATATANVPSQPIPIGTIALAGPESAAHAHHRSTTIGGLGIVTQYQGQGYGSEAILWVLEFAFRHANMHRVEIGAFEFNPAWKLYERLGFVHEGRKRGIAWYDGKYCDSVEMSMLEDEWRERYGKELQDGQTE